MQIATSLRNNSLWEVCFASTRPVQIATFVSWRCERVSEPLPPHAPCRLQRREDLAMQSVYDALPPHAPCRLQHTPSATGFVVRPLPPHAPCRLQQFVSGSTVRAMLLCLHTPRADCNYFWKMAMSIWLLCLHTPRADCNGRRERPKTATKKLCLHTPRADCNAMGTGVAMPAWTLPPHAPCRLQRQKCTECNMHFLERVLSR